MKKKKFPVDGSGAFSKLNNDSIIEISLSDNSGDKKKIIMVIIMDINKKTKKVKVVVLMIRLFLRIIDFNARIVFFITRLRDNNNILRLFER